MKKLTVIALTLLAAGAAMADGGASAALSREQVIAELQRARAAGEMDHLDSEIGYTPQLAVSTKTRAEVVAELQRARAAGEMDQLDSEGGYVPKITTASTTTRAQVLAELERARASGELELINSEDPSRAMLLAERIKQASDTRVAGQPVRAAQ